MRKKLSLVFSVLFLDFFSFSAVIAFLPLIFLETNYSLFSFSIPSQMRYLFLGLVTATYPIAQVLSAPILGHLSDKMGRRSILLSSYLGNTLGYFLCGLGVWQSSLFLLFLGNFVAGITGVNLSTTNAIISDESSDHKRSKFFAIPYLMLGLGFILGPYVTGKVVAFSSSLSIACFGLFLACAFLSFCNFLLLYFFFKREDASIVTLSKISWKELLTCSREVKILLFGEFLILFGWYFFIKSFQVFLIEGAGCSDTQVFSLYSQYGVWFTISQLLFIFWLHRQAKSEVFLRTFILLFAVSIFALVFVSNYTAACLVVPFFTFAYAALSPALTGLISDYASSHNNGKVMGLHQAIQAFAKIGGPLLAGCVLPLTPSATIILSPLFILGSLAVFKLREKKSVSESAL